MDRADSHYPSILGNCPVSLVKDRWYTLTVEIHGRELIAQLDKRHFVIGEHPIIDRRRTYFAFQVDRPGAAFDNIEIREATQRDDWPELRAKLLEEQAGRPAIEQDPGERYRDAVIYLRDKLNRTDAKYRKLVERIAQTKAQAKQSFPQVFSSHKEITKKSLALRKQLIETDPKFKQMRNTINKAKRAERDHLHQQNPKLDKLPHHQYAAALEIARLKAARDDVAFKQLVAGRIELEQERIKAYPKAFIASDSINIDRKKARGALKSDAEFKKINDQITAAVRAEKNYLLSIDPNLKSLEKAMKAGQQNRN